MISLEEIMKAPGKVRLPTPGQGTSSLPDRVAEQLRAAALAAGDRDRATHVPWPSGPRRRPPATAYGAQGCPASPRAALGLARLRRVRRLLPEAGRAHVGRGRRLRRHSGGPEVLAAFRGARPRRPQAETAAVPAAAPAAREGRALPAQRRRKRGEERAGPAPGPPCGAEPALTVPPSLMMIFLASMILRFAARFFFFPWVILPSSTPGAAAATQGAGGPSGECGPATTAGPSHSGRTPPS